MSVAEFGLGGGNSGDGRTGAVAANSAQLGLWALLATVTMLFAGFTSAYLVRRAGSDWQSILSPSVLCFNTVLLLASSMTLEIAREAMHRHQSTAFKLWHSATTLLGLAFLIGQIVAWQQLAARGIYVPTSPHSSFFYMLTAVHGVHLLGGVFGLLYVLQRSWQAPAGPKHPFRLCATYWHFVRGIWVFLFLLLFVWK